MTDAQKRAANKYLKKFDTFLLRFSEGEKERVEHHATEMNESLASFIRRAIDETIERDLSIH